MIKSGVYTPRGKMPRRTSCPAASFGAMLKLASSTKHFWEAPPLSVNELGILQTTAAANRPD